MEGARLRTFLPAVFVGCFQPGPLRQTQAVYQLECLGNSILSLNHSIYLSVLENVSSSHWPGILIAMECTVHLYCCDLTT